MHVLNILWVVFGIGLMLVLNLKFKINSMVAAGGGAVRQDAGAWI